MKPSEIIKKDMERNGMSADEQRFLDGLATVIKQKKATLLQHGNTVAVLFRVAPDTIEFHFYTTDKLPAMEKAMKLFYEKVKATGVKSLVSETENFHLVQAAKKLGIPIQATRVGDKYKIEIQVQ